MRNQCSGSGLYFARSSFLLTSLPVAELAGSSDELHTATSPHARACPTCAKKKPLCSFPLLMYSSLSQENWFGLVWFGFCFCEYPNEFWSKSAASLSFLFTLTFLFFKLKLFCCSFFF